MGYSNLKELRQQQDFGFAILVGVPKFSPLRRSSFRSSSAGVSNSDLADGE
jgi:hypothetical protein